MLKISDDSGFLAIVDPSKYNSFVNAEWNFKRLSNHFINQMNVGALIIWATNEEGEWTVEYITEKSNRIAYKEFTMRVIVTGNRLFLTNYEDLTMAASYTDESIPSKRNADLYFNVESGHYNVTIRQLFDPRKEELLSNVNVHFELILEAAENPESEVVKSIPWFEE